MKDDYSYWTLLMRIASQYNSNESTKFNTKTNTLLTQSDIYNTNIFIDHNDQKKKPPYSTQKTELR